MDVGEQNFTLNELQQWKAPRRIVEFTLDDNLSPIPAQTVNAVERDPPLYDVGIIDSLPVELVHEVLKEADLQCLINFRRVNRQAAELVESLPEYKLIMSHAQNALVASIRTGCAISITCQMLYGTLCTAKCEECGDFGGYIYLLTCTRVCETCFTQKKRFLPLKTNHAYRTRSKAVNNQSTTSDGRTTSAVGSIRQLCGDRLLVIRRTCCGLTDFGLW
jgi:F-box associated protein